MAATPPMQLLGGDLSTPPTPLHGAAYDNLQSPHRYSTRSSHRRISSRDQRSTPEALNVPRTTRSAGTPGSSRRTSQISQPDLPRLHSPQPHSPQSSPKNKAPRRVHVISPSSPDFAPSAPYAATSSNSHRSHFASSTTTMNEGMLPTPVKTPKKKAIPKINGAARVLFQDQPVIGEEVASTRRGRKGKRYNGFSLESFSADAGEDQGRIQIFTDSRDKVPQADTNDSNPFVEYPQRGEPSGTRKLAGTSKRRKISGEKKEDPQVAEAIKKDEGMVYVFRGKKVYRRFEDADDEEEVIDTEDLGLLEHTPNGTSTVRPLKTLTRKSIRPTRLFQSEEQKRTRELEKEEEAATDIEHDAEAESVHVPAPTSPASQSKPKSRARRSAAKKPAIVVEESIEPAGKKSKEEKPKKGSPFDTWRRLKAGSGSSGTAPKSKKREASEALEDVDIAEKKIKAA